MKLQYEKETIEQVLSLLNGVTVAGLDNIERMASIAVLLGRYSVMGDENLKAGESVAS